MMVFIGYKPVRLRSASPLLPSPDCSGKLWRSGSEVKLAAKSGTAGTEEWRISAPVD